MSQLVLFPFSEYWWIYLSFTIFVAFMLVLDLGVFHKKSHEVSVKESLTWSFVWISLALLFNVGLYYYVRYVFPNQSSVLQSLGLDPALISKQLALEFFTGFVIEKTLAIDNIFVFVVVFSYFRVPLKYQHRVLFYGIIGALAFRAVFIALGSTLLQYHWIVLVAGGFLVLTGLKILFAPEKIPDPGSNPLIILVKKFFLVTDTFHGKAFFVKKNSSLYVTPLFLTLVFIEFSDIVFAIDSVPAIFAITKEPLIVFTSNIFAILGLRSLYFMLAGVVDKFRFLKYGLGLILVFVGLKMTWLNELYGGKFPIIYSLLIIGIILIGSILVSLIIKPKLKLE